jgi:phytanoyl-CoA hydroxylase
MRREEVKMRFFGHLGDIADPERFFREQEYVVCRGALDGQAIGSVLDAYHTNVMPSNRKYLRQSGRWERNQMTPYGGVGNGLLNPHGYERDSNGRFADRVLKLLSTPAVRQTLALISGKSVDFTLYQTMLFDQSITGPHQDWNFLDSRPNGHLIAGWIALEDILPEGIRFYVYPGSHHFLPRATYTQGAADLSALHRNFTNEIRDYLASERPEMYAPSLRKGDIFFWGSRVIHGSTPGTDPRLRRRSIAAHFVPDGFRYGNLERDINLPYRERYSLRYAYHDMDMWFEKHNTLAGLVRRVAERVSRRLNSMRAGSGTARKPKVN